MKHMHSNVVAPRRVLFVISTEYRGLDVPYGARILEGFTLGCVAGCFAMLEIAGQDTPS